MMFVLPVYILRFTLTKDTDGYNSIFGSSSFSERLVPDSEFHTQSVIRTLMAWRREADRAH